MPPVRNPYKSNGTSEVSVLTMPMLASVEFDSGMVMLLVALSVPSTRRYITLPSLRMEMSVPSTSVAVVAFEIYKFFMYFCKIELVSYCKIVV